VTRRNHRVSASPCLRVVSSLRLFMVSMLAATATELTKLQPIGCSLLILSRNVVAALAFVTLKDDVVSRHNAISDF